MEKCMRPERAGIADVFYDVAMYSVIAAAYRVSMTSQLLRQFYRNKGYR